MAGPYPRPRRRFSVSSAVGVTVLLVARVAGETFLPGDSRYVVDLSGIQGAGGTVTPEFSSSLSTYNLTVTQDGATSVGITLLLDLTKYDPMHCPKIMVDGQLFEYTPLDEVRVNVPLGSTLGPVEKDVHIKISDPSTKEGTGWFGFMQHERAREYVVHVVKPPEFQRLVRATAIVVKDSSGREVPGVPVFDALSQQDQYAFSLPREETQATVQVTCADVDGDTGLVIDGASVPLGTVKTLEFGKALMKRTSLGCTYANERWSSQRIERMYELTLGKHVDAAEAKTLTAELVALPQFGYCETVSSSDPALRWQVPTAPGDFAAIYADTGFVCRADQSISTFVATFSSATNADLRASLISRESGQQIRMANALPTDVRMAEGRQLFTLEVKAGDMRVVYPAMFLWPGSCSTTRCPSGEAVRPPDQYVAQSHMCREEKCSKDDVEHCCTDVARCNTYTFACPANTELRPSADQFPCREAVCTEKADQDMCCAVLTSTTTTETRTVTSRTSTSTSQTRTSSTSSTSEGENTTTVTTTSTRTRTSKTHTPSTTQTVTRTTTNASRTRTTISSSSTSTETTSTTSTSMYCFESNVAWMPLDLPNTTIAVVEDQWACQDRCRSTHGCRHFAFWRRGGHCHLQDHSAVRMPYGFGFESGPPECLPENTVTRTTTNPLKMNLRCLQEGVNWSPLMGLPVYFEGVQEAVVLACQQWCRETAGCAHFTMEITDNACRLAGVSAEPLRGYAGLLSGPPSCEGVYEELDGFAGAAPYGEGFEPVQGAPRWVPPLPTTSPSAGKDKRHSSSNLRCFQEGVVWNPMLGVPTYYGGSKKARTLACQGACQQMPSCAHFTVNALDGECRFADASAGPEPGPDGFLSGPPTCDAVYEEVAHLLKKFPNAPGHAGGDAAPSGERAGPMRGSRGADQANGSTSARALPFVMLGLSVASMAALAMTAYRTATCFSVRGRVSGPATRNLVAYDIISEREA